MDADSMLIWRVVEKRFGGNQYKEKTDEKAEFMRKMSILSL